MITRSFVLGKRSQGNIILESVDGLIEVRLHGHVVFKQVSSKVAVIDSCGYLTPTTKTAINRAFWLLESGRMVSQTKGKWYLHGHDTNKLATPFENGMMVEL